MAAQMGQAKTLPRVLEGMRQGALLLRTVADFLTPST